MGKPSFGKGKQSVRVLGIETSCDETAAAVVAGLPATPLQPVALSNVVHSQVALHAPFGGVVPEVASREHVVRIGAIVGKALRLAHQAQHPEATVHAPKTISELLDEVDAIAVTAGPGLSGALLVGLQMAKGLAAAKGLPWLAVHHLEGHLAAASLSEDCPTGPHVAFVVSGGHTHLYAHRGIDDVRLLGATRDDAAGEAFDKVAKLLGLGYPGGPRLEAAAAGGDPHAYALPRAMPGSQDLSFSGLKTAVRLLIATLGGAPAGKTLADVCASVQEAIADALALKAVRAARAEGLPGIVLAGGVAANGRVRTRLAEAARQAGLWSFAPPKALCTDNAAMVAAAGRLRLLRGERSDWRTSVRSRWPLGALERSPCQPREGTP